MSNEEILANLINEINSQEAPKRIPKRQMTEKQMQNWKKAQEARKRNTEIRRKAREELLKYEQQTLSDDPEVVTKEKTLKELLDILMTGSSKPKRTTAREGKSDEEVKTKENVEIVRIPRIKKQYEESEKDDDEAEENEEEDEVEIKETKPTPAHERREAPKYQPKVRKAPVGYQPSARTKESIEPTINIFRD